MTDLLETDLLEQAKQAYYAEQQVIAANKREANTKIIAEMSRKLMHIFPETGTGIAILGDDIDGLENSLNGSYGQIFAFGVAGIVIYGTNSVVKDIEFHITCHCPKCDMLTLSAQINSMERLGEMLIDPKPHWKHRCPQSTPVPNAEENLLQALAEYIQSVI